jgi:HxlR-like helix-turn-helix
LPCPRRQRTRNRYLLTEKGADLFPVIVSLMQWGNRWLSDSGGPAELLHRSCGGVVAAELRCEHGHKVELVDLDLAART